MNQINILSILPTTKGNISPFSYVSKITSADKELVQKTVLKFRPASKNYEDSWGYIIQATRYKGFKWYDPETGSLIFFGRKSDTDSTLVVPSFFATPVYLAHVVETVQSALQAPQTILKNVNASELNDFSPYGFRPYKKNELWSPEASSDDQTYPQQIIDLKRFTRASGKDYHNLRIALNKNPNIIIRKYRETDKDAVLEIFVLKDKKYNDRSDESNRMFYVSHAMYPTADIDKFVTIDNETDKIIGFTAISDISPKIIASVASLFKPDAQKIRSWCTYQILAEKYRKGFQFVNLGGSEFKDSYNFRQWTFRPIEELEKKHLVYDPRKLTSSYRPSKS